MNVGPYRIVETLGEGGMGVVYLAEQSEPVKRQVALKLVRPGLNFGDVVTRFERERQALAVMDHASIAKVYDGGETEDGRPFFAMELVRGAPINRYCDERRMSIDDRLDLFIPVCEAVQHAHQKGVIHRDLKPSNVLVSDGNGKASVKVIDFGIAKAFDQQLSEHTLQTETGLAVGTPVYMSPEQAAGTGVDIDTRADIYSLGVTLYELLVGELPFTPDQLNGLQALYSILEREPQTPSDRFRGLGESRAGIAGRRATDPVQLAKRLSGDLDWITMKAMDKDRDRRYATADTFAADLRRYLADEPVQARPPTPSYRVAKFVRRNSVGVIAASLLLLTVLIGAAATTIGFVRASQSGALAEREAITARRTAGFLTDLFEVSDPSEARGNSITAREVLDRGAERIRAELSTEPEVQARLMTSLGSVYRSLGLYETADGLLLEAVTFHDTRAAPDAAEYAETRRQLGALRYYQGRLRSSEAELRAALELQASGRGGSPAVRALILNDLAVTLAGLGRYAAAESVLREVLTMSDVPGRDPLDVAETELNLASILADKGEYAAAESLYTKVLTGSRAIAGDNHPIVANGLELFAGLEMDTGDYDAADTLINQALLIRRRVEGEGTPAVGYVLSFLGLLAGNARSNLDSAETLYRAALNIGERHGDLRLISTSLSNLGDLRLRVGDVTAAESFFVTALDLRREGSGDLRVANVLQGLATVMREKNDLDSAEALGHSALAVTRDVWGDGHPDVARALNNLTITLRAKGTDLVEVESMYREVLAIDSMAWNGDHPSTAATWHNLGTLLRDQGQYAEAEAAHLEALRLRRHFFGLGSYEAAGSLDQLASVYQDQEQYETALPLRREALEVRLDLVGEDHPSIGTNLNNVARTLQFMARYDEAETMYRDAIRNYESAYGERHRFVAIVRKNLAEMLVLAGRHASGYQEALQAADMTRDAYGETHWRMAVADGVVGTALVGLARFDEAETTLLRSHDALMAASGAALTRKQESLQRLVDLYAAWERPTDQSRFQAMLDQLVAPRE